jgi:uncharacterized protein (TIGR01244 family)
MNFFELDKRTLVADGPLQDADLADAAARGVTLIVNNRPDGEEPGQTTAAELEAAARAAGLDYKHIPVTTDFPKEKVVAMDEALGYAEGRILLGCRSGTRSTYLWALARARGGAVPSALVQRAAAAGYNIRPILPWLKPRED